MPKYRMCLIRETGPIVGKMQLPSSRRALWIGTGPIVINANRVETGTGQYFNEPLELDAHPIPKLDFVRFELNATGDDPVMLATSTLLLDQEFEHEIGNFLMRLDRVTFPPGACAFRHIHPGPGIRYLTHGQLEIISDHHAEMANQGHAWFEPTNSPVRAVASQDHAQSQFVRCMVLPEAYAGKPSIKILNAADQLKPRLQVTHRFFDQEITLT